MMLSSGFPLEQALEMVPLVLPDEEAAGRNRQDPREDGRGRFLLRRADREQIV